MPLSPGVRIGPYEVLSLLGAGGMGEVYRARDTRLGREAALKILPQEFSASRERVARFEQEACSASSLNHPNIVTIYDVGWADGAAYVGMELVSGSTLREVLVEGPLPPRRLLAIGAQIAQGLAAAHEAGIVHRDVKPENVMVTRDGRVKILDFGLAKLAPARADVASQVPTAAQATQPGAVVGTVSYMSPEQVRGLPLDHRTDLFSLGAVLYEMAVGARPFRAATAADTMTAILREEPADLPAGVSPALERIIRRCLEKVPEQRFQSARDLAFALEAVSGVSSAVAPLPEAGESRRRLRAAAIAGAALAIFAAGLLVRPLLPGRAAPSFSRAVRLTAGPAREFGPALSPDGKWVAYLSSDGSRTDVWVKFLAGGDAACLTRQSALQVQTRSDIGGLEITPDGTAVLASLGPPGALPSSAETGTWALPAPLGGVPRRFLPGAHAVRFSPDGRRILFVRAGGSRGDSLVVAEADGGNPREILKSRGGVHAHWPAWSADGRFVYFNYGIGIGNAAPTEIYRIPPAGGAPEPVVRTSRSAAYPALLAGGGGLVYSSNPDSADSALWWRPLSGGPPRRLTIGVGSYTEPRLSADGNALVATVVESQESLLSVPVGSKGEAVARPITGGYTGGLDPAVSPRGDELAYSSTRSGNRNLWLCAPDGSSARPLTSGDAIDERPAFSPDGTRIAFVSDRGGTRGIWLLDVGGGAPRRLAAAEVLGSLSWSPDGAEIAFAAPVGDVPGLFRLRVSDGHVAPLPTPGASSAPAWSPRGDRIAYLDPKGPGGTRIELVDPAGRPIPLELPGGGPSLGNGYLTWSPDGKRIAAMAVPGLVETAVWIVEPGAAEPVRHLITLVTGRLGRGLAWGADGRSLLVGSLETSSDIVLFTRDR
ncbi:MAG: protein kinase domain-containing protein [Acidithiobacillales bacterium]